LQLPEQAFVAGEEPRLEGRGAHRHVGARHAQAVIDRTHGMADLLAEIPEHVEDVFGDLLAPGRLLVGQDEQQVDVRPWRQRTPAITADGGERDGFGTRGIVHRVDPACGKQMYRGDDLVFGIAQVLRAARALARGEKFDLGAFACLSEGLADMGEHNGASSGGFGRVFADRSIQFA
jgi:hypothetical protein